jgi:hypothetical protein
MRERPKQRSTNPFDGLEALAAPKQPSPEFVELARILEHAKTVDPADKKHFVDSVIAALESHALAIRIDETGQICRRLYIDRNGIIELQTTDGGHRGFKEVDFTLVPYVRPYRRRNSKSD